MRRSWDERFMRDVYEWSWQSKDPRTKIGAVLVKWDEKDPIAHGYNGFPRKVLDLPDRWNNRETKYSYVCHAEANSVFNCARTGRPVVGTVMFTNGVPCDSCAKVIIQAGVTEVIVHKQWQEYEQKFNWNKWINSAKISEEMFQEAGVAIRVFDKVLGMEAMLDGKVIEV